MFEGSMCVSHDAQVTGELREADAIGPAADLREAPSSPPEAWDPMHQAALRILSPIERFLHVQTTSGYVLLLSAIVAIAWANSPWAHIYETVWQVPIHFGAGGLAFEHDLHFVINEGLMVVFFFVVGLEIRREIHEGELADLSRAALPLVAAFGGMIAPAAIYLAINQGTPAADGWGVPMATDIAFAVGVLALLGPRVPPALRVLLLALAIIDDIGGILVIAFFYSGGIDASGVLIALSGMTAIFVMRGAGVRQPGLYVAPGMVIWFGFLRAGIHPSIAGVAIGLITPVKPWFGRNGFIEASRKSLAEFSERAQNRAKDEELWGPLERLGVAQREALPPVVRLGVRLHPYVAFGIMPLFALANAGIALGGDDISLSPVSIGVAFGLVVGKPFGIVGLSMAAVKLGLCRLPVGVDWRGLTVVGCVAGVGFTMALFIANLAFGAGDTLEAAKLGIIVGSATVALIGLALGRTLLSRTPIPGAAKTATEAERSALV